MASLLPGPAWLDYLEDVSSKSDGTWIFRGQSNSSWGLRPSVGRPEVCGPAGYDRADEKELLIEFKRQALQFENGFTSDLEWLALAQHHWLPTRLLDWTTNPMVAAWFATENEASTADGRIHMIRFAKGEILDEVPDPIDPGVTDPFLVRVPPKIARVTAQQGLFSLHPDPTLPWVPRSPKLRYEAFDLPAAEKPFFRQALNSFGFNRGRLMTDLDGLGATLSWGYRTRI